LGQRGRQAGSIDLPTLTANIFASVTNRAKKAKQGRLAGPLSSLSEYDVYDVNPQKGVPFPVLAGVVLHN
jgi:hypothetical protein